MRDGGRRGGLSFSCCAKNQIVAALSSSLSSAARSLARSLALHLSRRFEGKKATPFSVRCFSLSRSLLNSIPFGCRPGESVFSGASAKQKDSSRSKHGRERAWIIRSSLFFSIDRSFHLRDGREIEGVPSVIPRSHLDLSPLLSYKLKLTSSVLGGKYSNEKKVSFASMAAWILSEILMIAKAEREVFLSLFLFQKGQRKE